MDGTVPLTSLAHGGGCGCKLAPSVLRQILQATPVTGAFANLMVGQQTQDDAAVYRIDDKTALIATTDFFTPVVDDPYDFGRIAATNAISDVYAMGGKPIMALALLGMPLDRVPMESVQQIVAGGAAICAGAGIPVAGGHSIDSAEPIYGLVVLGLAHPDRIRRNDSAQTGDRIILTKGLGIGIFSAALKRGLLPEEGYATMLRSTTQLNAIGPALAERAEVHAMTDVTGFGLLGHLLEMARGASRAVDLRIADVPVLPGAAALAQSGLRTGASTRNWASYGAEVRLPVPLPDWQRDLLCDPQTSGGLLLAVAPEAVPTVLSQLREAGFAQAAEIGIFSQGEAQVTVV